MLRQEAMRAGYFRRQSWLNLLLPRLPLFLAAILLAAPQLAQAAEPPNGEPTSTFSISGFIKATSRALGVGGNTPRYQPTRFIIGLDKPGKFQVFSLTHPNRVIIEVPNVGLTLPTLNSSDTNGLVTSLRSGVAAADKVRIVLNVAAPVIVKNSNLSPVSGGHGAQELSIDIVPVTNRSVAEIKQALKERIGGLGGTGISSFNFQPPSPRPAQTPKQLRARSFKPVIVIDPGHGGHDSGAQKYGVNEKDVVLAFSKTLRDKLLATGRYRVLMTRSTDEFISLDDRREFADENKAALFIAVHADYASTNASGATIYSLRERVAKSLKRSAKKEVARNALGERELKAMHASMPGTQIVKGILSDLAEREVEVTRHRTDIFTKAVVHEMGTTTEMRSQPHRSAAFRVIKTAKMPSVLIELAYVSNRRDARRLQSTTWRNKVSQSIATAVDSYFANSLSRVPM
ncbi:MAG TPA: N-acetylmuramoyl-L-alanine amidase [Hyphomicrobiaceae bacterium]|nr:N-acetylmuramoyl-L-alanine amidase [Hyphomicrobiaceae bacterium]